MKIEEAIKQTKFTNPYQKAYINIIYTANNIQYGTSQILKPFDLTLQQFNILRILRGQKGKPASVNLLMDRMLDKTSNVSRLVEKLRTKSLIERTTCSSDRRQVDVVLTELGAELLLNIDEILNRHQSSLGKLTQEEAETLSNLLDKARVVNHTSNH